MKPIQRLSGYLITGVRFYFLPEPPRDRNTVLAMTANPSLAR
jgi:hypothetical protein